MMRQEHWPVVIVGAGPTGLTLANLLGDAGIRVLLLERSPSTVQEPRAVSIDDESLRSMQAAGLVGEVLSQIVPGYGSHYFDKPKGRCFTIVEPTGTPYGYPRRNAFRQPILEAQLRNGLARYPHVTARFEHVVESLSQTSDNVAVTVRRPTGQPIEVNCGYLIGCDGASSAVRRWLGIKLEGSSFRERWLIVDLENSKNTTRHTEVFCNSQRPCITLPGPNGTRRFEFKLHEEEDEKDLLAPAMIARLLADHNASPHSTIVRKVVYTFHARVATHWSEGRIFLAGDAAHLTPPFAGQGMNSGIRDAHNLAWKLAMVVRKQLGPMLLASYEIERRDHVWQMIELALRMGRIFAPRNEVTGWATRTCFRALGLIPGARDYIAQMKYKPKPRFASGFIVPDGSGSRSSLVGRLFPQPHVAASRGRRVLLDDVLGNRFALLVRSVDADRAFTAFCHPLWERLGAILVLAVPPGAAVAADRDVTVVVDEDKGLAEALAGYPHHAVLLRPDHYVAACLPLSDIERSVQAIAALIDETWPGMSVCEKAIQNREALPA